MSHRCLILLAVCICSGSSKGQNLLVNGSFEDGFNGWGGAIASSGSSWPFYWYLDGRELDPVTAANGNHWASLLVPNYFTFNKLFSGPTIDILPRQQVTLTGFANLSTSADLIIELVDAGASPVPPTFASTTLKGPRSAWTPFELTGTPPLTGHIGLAISAQASPQSARINIDGLQLLIVPEPHTLTAFLLAVLLMRREGRTNRSPASPLSE